MSYFGMQALGTMFLPPYEWNFYWGNLQKSVRALFP